MQKRVSQKWFFRYFGLSKERFNYFDDIDWRRGIYETDGGRATQDFDRIPEAMLIWQSSSKSYWAYPTR